MAESLAVIIIIAALSAFVLPKYRKMWETQKTNEADAVLHIVRLEQELRCVMGKPYATLEQLSALVPSLSTKNFTYTQGADGKSLIATSNGAYTYQLKMLSYRDGRICCTGQDCSKLNKNYLQCGNITAVQAPECQATPVTLTEAGS